jgi:putative DNA primase/helicase
MSVANGHHSTAFDVAPDAVAGLLPHHLAELRASGLSDETIRMSGIHSEVAYPRLASILNWSKYPGKHGAGLVFPYFDETGATVLQRVKPSNPRMIQGRVVKYESPKGSAPRAYIPRDSRAAIAAKGQQLAFTEGEKKCLSLVQHGMAAIGLGGVSTWCEPQSSRLLAELERIDWSGREVLIVFDSDSIHKPEVALEESKLAQALTQRGAAVKVVRLPDGPLDAEGQPTKQGVDDFIVANGITELWKLVQAAQPADALTVDDSRLPAGKMDPRVEIEKLLEIEFVDGVSRYAFYNGAMYRWTAGKYVEVTAGEMRARLTKFLNRRWSHLTTSTVSNCTLQMQAQTLLPGTTPKPSWIGEPPVDWDPRDVLVCRNGLLNLARLLDDSKEYLLASTPRFFTTVGVDYEFSDEALEPTNWLKFLRSLWPDDAESILLLQMWFGYCLVPDTRQQKALLLVGSPRSGKGTIARVIKSLVGNGNVCGPSLGSLAGRFGLWDLLDKSLAVISDARLSGRSDQAVVTERLLSITGEDVQSVDRKCLPPIVTTIGARLMILTNELPRLVDSSQALANRMLILHTPKSFLGKEDMGLTDRLLEELPSILWWAIDGWDKLRKAGHFFQPQSAERLRQQLHDLSSPISVFVRERLVVQTGRCSPVEDVYAEWVNWCKEAGRKEAGTIQTFGRDLTAALPGVTVSRPRDDAGDRYRQYEGVGIRGMA